MFYHHISVLNAPRSVLSQYYKTFPDIIFYQLRFKIKNKIVRQYNKYNIAKRNKKNNNLPRVKFSSFRIILFKKRNQLVLSTTTFVECRAMNTSTVQLLIKKINLSIYCYL